MGNPAIRGGSRWLLPGLIILLVFSGAAAAWLAPDVAPYIGFAGLILGLTAASVLFYRRSSDLTPSERRAWRTLAGGVGLFASGVLTVGILDSANVQLPAFGPLDVFFIGAYIGIIAALYQLARLDSGGREWVLTVLDASVGAIALAVLVWNALFSELVASVSSAPVWEVAIAALYPIVDIAVVIALIILVMRRSNYHLDLRLVFIAIGGGAQVLADLVYLSRSVGEDFGSGEPAWALNLFATGFILLTASIVDRTPKKREFPEAPTPVWVLIWPYFLAAVLVAVHFQNYRELGPTTEEVLLLDAVVLIGVVILLRQVYVIYRDRNRVDRKRAELVASVSHELRTPLTAMVGFLTLLDEHGKEFPAEARDEMISEATDQARHMSRLVSDLLMLAKGDPGQMTLELRDVRAIGIVVSVLRNMEPSDTVIEEDLGAEVTVHVDPDRIKQALSNLMNNAVRYGGERALIVAKVSGDDLVFEVHDDGDGVPTRYESIIWQHFERGAHRLDATTPGLGIGLSIVQAVARSHGGSASYRESERLGGACFSIVIPDCLVEVPEGEVVGVGF